MVASAGKPYMGVCSPDQNRAVRSTADRAAHGCHLRLPSWAWPPLGRMPRITARPHHPCRARPSTGFASSASVDHSPAAL